MPMQQQLLRYATTSSAVPLTSVTPRRPSISRERDIDWMVVLLMFMCMYMC